MTTDLPSKKRISEMSLLVPAGIDRKSDDDFIDTYRNDLRQILEFLRINYEALPNLIERHEAMEVELKSLRWNNENPPESGEIIYGLNYGPMKFTHYKPAARKQGYPKGRWQEMNEYGGWDNCKAPDQWKTREQFDFAKKAVETGENK